MTRIASSGSGGFRRLNPPYKNRNLVRNALYNRVPPNTSNTSAVTCNPNTHKYMATHTIREW